MKYERIPNICYFLPQKLYIINSQFLKAVMDVSLFLRFLFRISEDKISLYSVFFFNSPAEISIRGSTRYSKKSFCGFKKKKLDNFIWEFYAYNEPKKLHIWNIFCFKNKTVFCLCKASKILAPESFFPSTTTTKKR